MENVTIVGAEDDVLVLATESGERFALPVDEVLRTELRRARAGREEKAAPLAASPREIQAHIRAGMSATDVAQLLGVSPEVVERFEGPVLAEREHVVGQALAVPVLIGSEVEPDAQPTFGVAIRAELAELSAGSERWVAWKEESGWIIKLEFTANEVDHDARWSFDPRRSALSPLNADATQLSRQGSLPEGLIPRLRALDKDAPRRTRTNPGSIPVPSVPAWCRRPPSPDGADDAARDAEPRSARHPQSSSNAQEAATRSASFAPSTPSDTADLLEALRRRRGQREARPSIEEEPDQARPLALFEALEPGYEPEPAKRGRRSGRAGGSRRRAARGGAGRCRPGTRSSSALAATTDRLAAESAREGAEPEQRDPQLLRTERTVLADHALRALVPRRAVVQRPHAPRGDHQIADPARGLGGDLRAEQPAPHGLIPGENVRGALGPAPPARSDLVPRAASSR